jgi:hypothetical protein
MTLKVGQKTDQTDQTTGQVTEPTSSRPWNMIVVLVALVLVSAGAICVLVVYQGIFENSADVTTVLGSWFTVVGTLVGSYFGVKAASDITDKTQGAIVIANNTANRALGELPPDKARDVLGSPPPQGSSPAAGALQHSSGHRWPTSLEFSIIRIGRGPRVATHG